MPFLKKARSFLRNLFSPAVSNGDLEQEIHTHLEMLIEENLRAGMKPEEAKRAAWIELGGTEQVKEQVREVQMGYWLQSVASDCRYGIRQLRKNPGVCRGCSHYTGAGHRRQRRRFCGVERDDSSPAECAPGREPLLRFIASATILRRNRILTISICAIAIAALRIWRRITFCRQGWTQAKIHPRVWLFAVSGNYFDVLGIQPYLGRFFHGSDEHGPNSAPYIVLSVTRIWHSHFQDDRGVVGRVVQVNKHPFTIIGVAPPEFHGTLLFFSSRFLFADGEPGTNRRDKYPERARKPLDLYDAWDI